MQATALRELAAGPALHRIVEQIGFPLVVKPARAGSAMGVSFVDLERDFSHALMNALSFSDDTIIERRIEGTELAAGMIADLAASLPLVESRPRRECSTTRLATRRVRPSTSLPRDCRRRLRPEPARWRLEPSGSSVCETSGGRIS